MRNYEIEKYINKIRNVKKREFANQYYRWMMGDSYMQKYPDYRDFGVSQNTAQNVINDIDAILLPYDTQVNKTNP